MSSTREQVEELLAEGLALNEIARRLGVAGPTVGYHVGRIRRGRATPEPTKPATPAHGEARAQVTTRQQVEDLLGLGWSRAAIARELRITRGTVTYHARRLGKPVDERGARRYDWSAIQRYYDEGHSVRECQERFGFSRESWHAAVKRGAVVARPPALRLDELLVADTHRGRHNLKRRLMRAGLKEDRCERCGLRSWRGRPLPLALHHVNGDRHDNRLSNLELLCPNCHSQTPNFAAGNGDRRRARRALISSCGRAPRV